MLNAIFDHQLWADRRTLGSLSSPDAPAAALALFAHIIGAETIWADRIDGVPQSVAVWPEPDLAGLDRRIGPLRDRYAGFCAGDLSRRVPYTNSAGHHFSTTVSDILTHVALHGAYHRGQVALLLRQVDIEPSPTDYIEFARGFPAAKNL